MLLRRVILFSLLDLFAHLVSLTIVIAIAITSHLPIASGEAGRPPRILEHPVDSVVPKNEPVTLNCRADGDPTPSLTWFKDGKPIRISDSRSLRNVLPTGSLFFLRVRKDFDSGVYNCQARNAFGEVTSRNATLDVATLRDDFKLSPRNIWAATGENAVLECEPPRGNPEPKVSWKKNGHPIDVKANGRFRIIGVGSLSISQVRQSDEGRYACAARNIVGIRTSSAALLRVTVRPQFTIMPANTSAMIGSDVSLACVARGDPPPEISWKRSPYPGQGLPLKRSTFDEERLLISNVSAQDSGTYVCVAENKAGSIEASATVTVLSPPKLTVVPSNLEIQPNVTAYFSCEVQGDQATLFWSREGSHSIIFRGSSLGTARVTAQGTLQIDNVSESDESYYFCAAVSPAGSTMHRVRLKVTPVENLPPPIISMGPSNQTRPLGSVAVMPCVAEGNPTPVITWYKNGTSFRWNHRLYVDDANTLRMSDLKKEDSGLYECVASSRSGKYVWRSYLTVEVPTNPSVVFRRTGFDMANLRPREPIKPQIVKVESTSVTIAWHPKYFQFMSESEQGGTPPTPPPHPHPPHPHPPSSPPSSVGSGGGGGEFLSGWSESESHHHHHQHQHHTHNHGHHHQHEHHRSPFVSSLQSGTSKGKATKRFLNGGQSDEDDYDDDDIMVDDLPPPSSSSSSNSNSKKKVTDNVRSWIKKREIAFESNDFRPHAHSLQLQQQQTRGEEDEEQEEEEEGELEFHPTYFDENEESDEIGVESGEEYKEEKIRPDDTVSKYQQHKQSRIEATEKNGGGANHRHSLVENIFEENDGGNSRRTHDNNNNLIIQSTRTNFNAQDTEEPEGPEGPDAEEEDGGDGFENQKNEPISSTTLASTSTSSSTTTIRIPSSSSTLFSLTETTTAFVPPPSRSSSHNNNNNNNHHFVTVNSNINSNENNHGASGVHGSSSSSRNSNNNNNKKQLTYKVEYYSADEVRTEWLLGATNVPNEIFTLNYLKPNTEYIFFVRSVGSDGLVSAPSPVSDSVMTTMTGNKHGHSDLAIARSKLESAVVVILKQAYATSSTSIRIEWQIVNAGEYIEGFYIYFRQQVGQQKDEGSYQMLTVLNAGASSFQIVGLDKYTTYQIFLLPFYKNVDGRPSNYVNVTTIQDVPSAAPELLDSAPVNISALLVRWKAPPVRHQNGIILGYQLKLWSGASLVANQTVNGTTFSSIFNNLMPGQSYSVQIASFTSKGVGSLSAMKTIQFRPDQFSSSSNSNANNNNNNQMSNTVNNNNNNNGGGGGSGGEFSNGNIPTNYKGKSSNSNSKGNKNGKGKMNFDGNNINFGGSRQNGGEDGGGGQQRNGDDMLEGYDDDDDDDDSTMGGGGNGIATFGGTAANNEFLTEAWFVALIGSVIFVLLLVFVFALYVRRCQLRKDSDKLKVSTEIPDGSMPPHYNQDENLWIDSQQKQLSLKSVKTNDLNEYENANNYAVVEDRHSPIPYATTTLINGEKHKSSFAVFGEPQNSVVSNGHVGRPSSDFSVMMASSPKIVGWGPVALQNNKTASLNMCSQDMKKELLPRLGVISIGPSSQSSRSKQSKKNGGGMMGEESQLLKEGFSMNSQDQMGKGASLNVLTTFQTPLPGRKHMVVDFSKGQYNSILHYHEPRLTSNIPHNSNSSNHHNGHSNHNAF